MKNKNIELFLYGSGKRSYDVNNVYGTSWESNGRLEGYHVWSFTDKKHEYAPVDMDMSVKGKVTVNGEDVPYITWLPDKGNWRPWKLAVDMRRVHMVEGGTYTVEISGFRTADGEEFPAAETVFDCPKMEKTADYKYDEHDEQTVNVAREGAVLLKNEGNVLPLSNKKINVFGDIYYRFFNMSGGAGCINPRFSVGFMSGMTEYGGFELNEELRHYYEYDFGTVPDKAMLDRARKFSDIAIVALCRGSRESTDNRAQKGGYYLSDTEEALIAAVSEVFEKTVVILNVGYTVDVKFIEKYNIKGVLWFSYGGQYAGRVLAEVLNGTVNPSGRLTGTWALDYYDHPASKNYPESTVLDTEENQEPSIQVYYEEGMYVGYRYFDTYGVPVAYPFGYGLSYTDFEHKYLDASYDGECLTLRAEVKNTGSREGKQVLQLYVSKPDGRIEKCAHELVDFQKTRELSVGESEVLTFTVDNMELSSYDTQLAAMVMEKGDYVFSLGEHVNSLLPVYTVTLDGEKLVRQLHSYCVAKEKFDVMSRKKGISPKGISYFDFERDVPDMPKTERKVFDAPVLPEYNGETIYYEDVEKNPDLLDSFIAQMSVEELARINVCACAWSIDANGVAGSVYPIEKYGFKHFYAADGNSALRMHLRTTGMPCSNMVCASFNRELVYTVGRVIAEESFDEGVHMSLAPGMNMHRAPLCGRNPEYFSEDPVLTGIMAAYHAKGLQDNNVAAVYKHVIANNNEISRFRTHAIIDPRTFRELYVKPFELAMRICSADGIMTSYNAANDLYTATDSELMLGIFREEMGFDGFIMTDWGSYRTADAVMAVANGNCWLTPGTPDDTYTAPIVEGVKSGRVSIHRLRDNVKHLVKVMLKYTRIFGENKIKGKKA